MFSFCLAWMLHFNSVGAVRDKKNLPKWWHFWKSRGWWREGVKLVGFEQKLIICCVQGRSGWLMMVGIWPLSPVSALKYVAIIFNRADRRARYLFLQGFRGQQMLLQLLSSLLEKLLQLLQLPMVFLFIKVDLLLQLESGWLGRIYDIIHLQADNWYDVIWYRPQTEGYLHKPNTESTVMVRIVWNVSYDV